MRSRVRTTYIELLGNTCFFILQSWEPCCYQFIVELFRPDPPDLPNSNLTAPTHRPAQPTRCKLYFLDHKAWDLMWVTDMGPYGPLAYRSSFKIGCSSKPQGHFRTSPHPKTTDNALKVQQFIQKVQQCTKKSLPIFCSSPWARIRQWFAMLRAQGRMKTGMSWWAFKHILGL